MKPPKEYKASGKNFYTNPGKKGTGYGYVLALLHVVSQWSSSAFSNVLCWIKSSFILVKSTAASIPQTDSRLSSNEHKETELSDYKFIYMFLQYC